MSRKMLSICLLVACVLDCTIPYLLAPFYKGYSHMDSVMSALGNPDSPVRVMYDPWLSLLGILLSLSC